MTPDQSPSLPVLPSTQRRRAAAARQNAALSLVLGGVNPPRRPPARSSRFHPHIGLAALCMTAVAMVATLVVFSILRDQAALRRPASAIVAPLHP